MARIHENFDEYRHGELVVKKCQPNCVEIFYIPSKGKLEQSGLDTDKAAEYCVKLLIINGQERTLTIFPTNTLGGHGNFLQPKYDQVERITLADGVLAYTRVSNAGPSEQDGVFISPYFGPTEPLILDESEALPDIESTVPSTPEEVMMVLENLPSAFTKDFDYGLGLAQEYRFIVEAVEALSDCTEIVISGIC